VKYGHARQSRFVWWVGRGYRLVKYSADIDPSIADVTHCIFLRLQDQSLHPRRFSTLDELGCARLCVRVCADESQRRVEPLSI